MTSLSSKSKSLIPLFLIAVISVFSYLQFYSQNKSLTKNEVANNSVVKKVSTSHPKNLQIPAINISAYIEQSGVTNNGEMEVPSAIANVGWYTFGAKIGDIGSAVISGHLNGKNGEAGVFSNLNKLKKGDKIFVTDETGNILIFIVTGSSLYKAGYAEEVFTKNDGKYLNLITCYGFWNKSRKSYDKRLVVFSTLEDLGTKPI